MTLPSLLSRLDEIETRAKAATQPPWKIVEYGDGDNLAIHDGDSANRICFMATHGGSQKQWEAIQANAALIENAPDDIPFLTTALRDALGQNHSAWLIERHKCGEPVQYWAASKWTDITSAVRFCRKKDAEEVAGGLANKFLAEYGKYETRVAEHKWLAPPTSKQQP